MFSDREIEVLKIINLTDDEIGNNLCISASTVKSHIHNIMNKLRVSTRANAVIAALKGKYIKVKDLKADYTKG